MLLRKISYTRYPIAMPYQIEPENIGFDVRGDVKVSHAYPSFFLLIY